MSDLEKAVEILRRQRRLDRRCIAVELADLAITERLKAKPDKRRITVLRALVALLEATPDRRA